MGKMYDKMIAVKDAAYNTGRGLGFAAAMYAATLFGCNNADKVEQPEPTPVVQQTETRPSYTTVESALEKAEDIKDRLRTILLYEREDDAEGHMTESEVQQFYELNEEFFSLRKDVKENELYDTGIESDRNKLKDMIGDLNVQGEYEGGALADAMEGLYQEIVSNTESPIEVYVALRAVYGQPVEFTNAAGETVTRTGFDVGSEKPFKLEGEAYTDSGDGILQKLFGDDLQLAPLVSKIQSEWTAPTVENTGLGRESIYIRIDGQYFSELQELLTEHGALPVQTEGGSQAHVPAAALFDGEWPSLDNPEVTEAAIMLVRKDGDYTVRDPSLVDAVKALED